MHVPASKSFRRRQNDIGEESDECDVASAIAWGGEVAKQFLSLMLDNGD